MLNSHPIQYFAPLYSYLNSAEAGIEVNALYLSDVSTRGAKDADFGREVKWDIDLVEGYPAVFLGERAHLRVPGGFWSLIAPEIWRELRSRRYDVLWLHGHNYAANLIALAAAKSIGMPVLMRGETHLALPRTGAKAVVRRPLIGALYATCDRLLAIGSANAAFYRAMGVPDHKLFLVPYTVDNQRFMKAAEFTPVQKMEARQQYGIRIGVPAILYAAKFSRRKRPFDLLYAAQRLKRESCFDFTLVMAGSGELEGELRTFCVENHIDNVVFPGFINQSSLPSLYAASDVFVLPSESEPWGLAVNEAMCAGLPIVAAKEIGCVPDLVEHGANGYTPAAGDVDGLVSALRILLGDEGARRRMGQASLIRISRWSYRECLEGICAALASLGYATTVQPDHCSRVA